MRPVGRQINEVVLDNDSPGVTFTGAWTNSSSTKYYDEDYGAGADAIPYRFASTVTGTETATATYTPNIPQAGFYPVYTWVLYGTDRTAQIYRVNHTGGTTEIRVDHSKVGYGWVYLGTYHFNAGSSATGEGSVQISNKAPVPARSSSPMRSASATAWATGSTRHGRARHFGLSARGREFVPLDRPVGRHWDDARRRQSARRRSNNVSAPSNMAQYMFHPTRAVRRGVYIGFHSNAGGGRGARGLIDSSVADSASGRHERPGDILGDQINQDMQTLNGVFEYNWTTGTTSTYHERLRRDQPGRRRRDGRHDHRGGVPRQRRGRGDHARPERPRSDRALGVPGNAAILHTCTAVRLRPTPACRQRRPTCGL